jgi:hypothetical protein
MIDRTTKLLLAAIAVGLFLNAAVPVIQPTVALAQGAEVQRGEPGLDRLTEILTDIDNKLEVISNELKMTASATENNDPLLNEADCKSAKDATGLFLYLADLSWKESERSREGSTEKLEADAAAMALSTLASNYSTVYSVFCKQ